MRKLRRDTTTSPVYNIPGPSRSRCPTASSQDGRGTRSHRSAAPAVEHGPGGGYERVFDDHSTIGKVISRHGLDSLISK